MNKMRIHATLGELAYATENFNQAVEHLWTVTTIDSPMIDDFLAREARKKYDCIRSILKQGG